MKNKNEELLKEFSDFCAKHPELRFFQALAVWMDVSRVMVEVGGETYDTYHWKDRINIIIN
jgi:hypothetical protein